jgi:hypothetical protein
MICIMIAITVLAVSYIVWDWRRISSEIAEDRKNTEREWQLLWEAIAAFDKERWPSFT